MGFGMTTFDSVAANNPPTLRWTRNAFLWRYPVGTFVLVVMFLLFDYLEAHNPAYMPLGLVFMLLELLLVAVFLVLALIFMAKRRFKLASAIVLGAVILSSPTLSGGHVGEVFFSIIDRIRFYFVGAQYAAIIDKMSPQERASTVVFFGWGEGGYFPTNFFYSVVYDESGEIARPAGQRSPAWVEKVRAHYTIIDSPRCTTQAFRLSGHYYSVTTIC